MTREEAIKWLEETKLGGRIMHDDTVIQVCDMALAAIQNQTVWIPVTERLPQNYISVLVYLQGERPLPTVHEAYIGGDGEWHSSVVYGVENEDVTHWIPMPEPPKGE